MKKPELKDLTLREKIGQCLCARQYEFNQKVEIDEKIPRTEEERDELLKKNPYGVYWCMGKQNLKNINIAEVNFGNVRVKSYEYREWVEKIERNLKIPGLRATDAEGQGAGNLFDDLTVVSGGLCVGAADSEELAYEYGAQVAKELLCAGINWRWAPVIDITGRRTYGFSRTFSTDVDRLIKLSLAHIKGMQDNGVAATAKHFPGGNKFEYRDSHFTPTVNSLSMEEWWEDQGRAFQEMIDGGVYSVMISHKAFPAADDTQLNGKYLPSTLSGKIITDLLKGEMGFEGVVITDGIGMGGLQSFYDREDLYVELLRAGNDVLLGVMPDGIDIVEKAVKDGRLSEERIDDACRRVLDMKEKMGLFAEDYSIYKYDAKDIAPKTAELSRKLSESSVTLVRDRQNKIPFDRKGIKKVKIICSCHDDIFVEGLSVMIGELEARGMEVSVQRRLYSKEALREICNEYDLIIYAAFLAGHRPMGAPSFYGEECATFQHAFSAGNEKSIGVSLGYPYIFFDFMGCADICINTYNDSPGMQRALVKAIFGEIPVSKSSPVNLNPGTRD